MTSQQMQCLIVMLVCAVIAVGSAIWGKLRRRRGEPARAEADKTDDTPPRLRVLRRAGRWLWRKTPLILLIVSLWVFIAQGLTLLFGPQEREAFSVELFAPRMDLFGLEISTTVFITWIAMAIILIAALLLRIFLIPRMKDKPGTLQSVLELCVSGVSDYTRKQTGGRIGDGLSQYLFSLALLMVVSAALELLGLRPPTADITMTLAMALITFVLINYYGIRKKGVLGRIKSLGKPNPVIFPIKVLSDIAVPVSLACRLFGNMLGGMIVIDLLYYALGNFGTFLPSVAGLYFNVFHPLIQIFIFVTLSLTFIDEAVE